MRIPAILTLTMFCSVFLSGNVACQENECGFSVPRMEGMSTEPRYINLVGYLSIGRSSYGDEYEKLTDYPWKIHSLKQVGPNLWDKSEKELLVKEKVKVLEQHLRHVGYGRYYGRLLVSSISDSTQYYINASSFCPVPYWECPPYEAIQYSPFIARVRDGVNPVTRKGRWVDIGQSRFVFCTGRTTKRYVPNGIECIYYGEGAKRTRIIVSSDDLEIIY